MVGVDQNVFTRRQISASSRLLVVHQRQQLRFFSTVNFRHFTRSVSIEAEIRRNGVISVQDQRAIVGIAGAKR